MTEGVGLGSDAVRWAPVLPAADAISTLLVRSGIADSLDTGSVIAPELGVVELSAESLSRVWAAVDASTSTNTKAAYRSDWGRFERWAHVAGQSALPASAMAVAAYLTAAAEERKPDGQLRFSSASLSRWASSINQVHTAGGFAAPGRSEVVRRALSGCAVLGRRRRNAGARCSWLMCGCCWRRCGRRWVCGRRRWRRTATRRCC